MVGHRCAEIIVSQVVCVNDVHDVWGDGYALHGL